jgi:SAM-dependent MidA family methyltransferase
LKNASIFAIFAYFLFEHHSQNHAERNRNAMKKLTEVIHSETLAHGGVLPFSRFMELALYCPKLGYYETKKDSLGRRGDFYTSVSVGNLFGELLAFQFAEWLEELKSQSPRLKIVEAGAHNGQLARDILTWLHASRPALYGKLEYCIIEPSEHRQKWQQEALKDFGGKVHWLSSFGSTRFDGIIFSNELLDAFPIQRFGWDAGQKKWFEWGVVASGEQFAWTKIDKPQDGLPALILNLPSALLGVLPDGYTVETSPAAESWWHAAANSLNRGKLMTVDYGLSNDELFLPSRKNGTLRAYFQHRFAGDLLANPGQQDLTAHVNFSAIQRAGEEAGLKTVLFAPQSNFLTQIMGKTLDDKHFGEWTFGRGRQFQTLTHPEHLGRAFRVLVQSR